MRQWVLWNQLTIAPDPRDQGVKTFTITHPFHPLFQKEYEAVDVRRTWGLTRVYYYNEQNKLTTLPLSWTSLQDPDPFVTYSEGRSSFRIQDLIELVSILTELSAQKEEENV